MQRHRRIAAYGVCRDELDRVLLVRGSKGGLIEGRWLLPGGGITHGEHPADAVVREVMEETGLRVAVGRPLDVVTDLDHMDQVPTLRHQDRLIYSTSLLGGTLRDESDGSTDCAAWVNSDDLAALPLIPFVAHVLGVPILGVPVPRSGSDVPSAGRQATSTVDVLAGDRRQRFAAYGLVTDPAGRILLTLIADGFPGAGSWHLPGGGTDFGESAVAGFLRELIEETDQRGRVLGLIDISHRHDRNARGPEGVVLDWHGVRVVFRAEVDEPTSPKVIEANGGSTAAAAWCDPVQVRARPLTEIARTMIDRLVAQ